MKTSRKFAFLWQILIIALLAIGFGLLTSAVLAKNTITLLDNPVSSWVNTQTTPATRGVFDTITLLGSYPVVRVMAVIVGLWLVYKRAWAQIVMLAALIAITILVTPLLKEVVARTRPALPQDSLYGKDASFPSGHTFLGTVFFAMTAYLGWIYAARRWLKWVIVALSVVIIILIGISRVFLEVHFLTDVLGGWIAGGLIFCLVLFLANAVFPSRRQQAERTPEA